MLGRLFWWVLKRSPAGGGRAGGVLILWLLINRLYRTRFRSISVRAGGVLEFRRAWRHGLPVLEVHLNNPVLASNSRDPHRWLAECRADLIALAARTDLIGNAKGISTVTIVAPATRRLGFEVRPVPRTFTNRVHRFFMVGTAAIHHPEGWRGIRHPEAHWLGEIWLPIEALRAMQRTSDELTQLSAQPGKRSGSQPS